MRWVDAIPPLFLFLPVAGGDERLVAVRLVVREAVVAIDAIAVWQRSAAALAAPLRFRHPRPGWCDCALVAAGAVGAPVRLGEWGRDLPPRRPLVDEELAGLFGDGCDEASPRRQGLGELVAEWREQAAAAAPVLVEVAGVEDAVGEEGVQVAVDVWPYGFHQVERKRVAAAHVGVQDAQGGVEPDG